jgi:hypothetical protein
MVWKTLLCVTVKKTAAAAAAAAAAKWKTQ